MNSRSQTLIGHYFHSKDEDGQIHWQGHVVCSPEPGYYLVQLNEWITGQESTRRLVRIDDMVNWTFYETADEMRFAYESSPDRLKERATDAAEGQPVCAVA